VIKTIIFDWKNTLYDPESKQLLPGVSQLLTFLKREEIPLMLISKGTSEMMGEVQRLDIADFFTKVIFLTAQKTQENFTEFITENPKDTWFVGDRIDSEIHIGKQLGATTVWLKRGPFAKVTPSDVDMPSFIVSSLDEVYTLFHEQLASAFTSTL